MIDQEPDAASLLENWTRALVTARPDLFRRPRARLLLARARNRPHDPLVLCDVWTLLDEQPDPAVGVKLARARLQHELGIGGLLASHSKTLGEALSRYAGFHSESKGWGEFAFGLREGRLEIWDCPALEWGDWPEQLGDAIHASILLTIRRILDDSELVTLDVDAQRTASVPSEQHAAVFGVHHARKRGVQGFSLSGDLLFHSIPGASPQIVPMLERAATAAPNTEAVSLSELTTSILGALRVGATQEVVAARLGVSIRTVVRAVSERGLRYVDLVDEVREREARRRFRRGETREEVAEALGVAVDMLEVFEMRWERQRARAKSGTLPKVRSGDLWGGQLGEEDGTEAGKG